ncbi:MAG: hypothetical protein PVI01_10825 [Gemmatimonadales bacterium]|jgi:hypothetical protein
MKRYRRAMGFVLGLAVLPLLVSCSDPAGLDEGHDDTGLEELPIHQKPMAVVIHPSAADIEVGQTIRLWVVLHAGDGRILDNDFPVRWSTASPERVSITDEGYATGVAPGNVRIMAESEFGGDWTYLTVRRQASGRDIPDDRDKKRVKLEEESTSGHQDRR